MDFQNFENIKNHIIHIHSMARLIRFACARYVYCGVEEDIKIHARMLVLRTMVSLNLHPQFDLSDMTEEQQSELISLATDALRDFVPLSPDRAAHNTGTQVREILTSGF